MFCLLDNMDTLPNIKMIFNHRIKRNTKRLQFKIYILDQLTGAILGFLNQ